MVSAVLGRAAARLAIPADLSQQPQEGGNALLWCVDVETPFLPY